MQGLQREGIRSAEADAQERDPAQAVAKVNPGRCDLGSAFPTRGGESNDVRRPRQTPRLELPRELANDVEAPRRGSSRQRGDESRLDGVTCARLFRFRVSRTVRNRRELRDVADRRSSLFLSGPLTFLQRLATFREGLRIPLSPPPDSAAKRTLSVTPVTPHSLW